MLPEKVAEVREWLTLAAEDLGLAGHILGAGLPYLAPMLFHCQQAAEKALKAYQAWHDRPFRRTHDLEELLAACAAIDPGFAALTLAARALSPHAIGRRYPSAVAPPTRTEAEEALRQAQEIIQFVLDRLPPDVQP